MSYGHLTVFDRARIEVLHKEGYSIREIGRQLSRNASTIIRELKRCKPGEYKAEVAHQDYLEKRKRVRCKGKVSPELVATIREKLEASWSPEQTVGRLFRGKLSFKTIYRWLYKGILGVDVKVLRYKGKKKQASDTRGTFTTCLSIHDRPEEVENRQTIGHWEADSVLSPGKVSKACVASFVERRSRLYLGFKMPDRTAKSMKRVIGLLAKMMGTSVETITSDRVKKFTCYEEIWETFELFADPEKPSPTWKQ